MFNNLLSSKYMIFKKKNTLLFMAVLGSEQNGPEVVESSYIPHTPACI